ncbi:MAG: sulfatase [Planctomycetota bacterium]
MSKSTLFVWTWAISLLSAAPVSGDDRPNVVLVLADDLGWSDLGCYGADLIETPHIDSLARSSVRFTQAYAPAPVCSPTRAAILTGHAPARLQMTIWSEGALAGPKDRRLLQAFSRHDLPLSEQTLAEYFQASGYLTSLVGKWHLGDAAHAPETQGFDVNIGGTHWGAPTTFFFPYRGLRRNGENRYVPHLEFGQPGEYLTDRLTHEAERIIHHATTRKQPFFLMLAHHAPHTPIEAKAEDVQHFAARRSTDMKHQHPIYAAMIRHLDESVGALRKCLQTSGVSDNTVIVFTSDNGGYIGSSAFEGVETPITNNWPLRSGKGTCYEGGLRVPLIIHWPEGQQDRTCREPVILTDLFRTLMELIPVVPLTSSQDGLSLLPLLRDPDSNLDRSELYFHYPHYYHAPPSTPVGAIRSGDWKLLEYFEDARVELFDLRSDVSESNDLSQQEPEVTQHLLSKLHKWRLNTGASMPTRNPAKK